MPMDSSIRRVIETGNCSRCMRSGTSTETDGTGISSAANSPPQATRWAAGGPLEANPAPEFGFKTGVQIHQR